MPNQMNVYMILGSTLDWDKKIDMENEEGLEKLTRSTWTLVVYSELHNAINFSRCVKDIKNCLVFQVLIENCCVTHYWM
jgi:hypothetical protein